MEFSQTTSHHNRSNSLKEGDYTTDGGKTENGSLRENYDFVSEAKSVSGNNSNQENTIILDEETSKNSQENFPPTIELIDLSEINDKTDDSPLNKAEQKTLSELEESIDSANFEEIYKIVKQFNDNPGSLLKIVRQLNKSLESYNMGADVESPDIGSGSLNLVLRQRQSDGESIYQGQISFSTKPGVPANESEQVDSVRGGGGSTRPLKPSKDAGRTTISDVLRRMSHVRTH